jgi:hypothetical protein
METFHVVENLPYDHEEFQWGCLRIISDGPGTSDPKQAQQLQDEVLPSLRKVLSGLIQGM